MGDLAQLLVRDHDQLDRAIESLIAAPTRDDRRLALEAARLAVGAHAEAEAMVLHDALARVTCKHDLAGLVAEVVAAHRVQESILRRMDIDARADDWRCPIARLRRALLIHAEREQTTLVHVLRGQLAASDYERLASSFCAEKLRALGLLATLDVSRRGAIRAHRRAMR